MDRHDQFRLSNLFILEVNAVWTEAEEPHVNWYISYAPEREEESDHRVLMATLHAVGNSCQGNIRVAATLGDAADFDDWDSFEDSLADSDALDTLYAYARTALRTVLSMVGGTVEVPELSPEPEFDQLVRADDAE